MRQFLLSYAMYAGGVIGVGMFGLPYVLERTGLVPTLLLGVLVCFVVYFVNALFADVVLATRGRHRIPGYIRHHLGAGAGAFSLVVAVLELMGGLLAYLVSGGIFLSIVLAPFVTLSPFVATLIYLACGAPLLIRKVERALPIVQLGILGLFVVTLLAIVARTSTIFSFERIPFIEYSSDLTLAYGVLLFSFWGASLIPEAVELAGRKRQRVLSVLRATYLTAALTYAVFAIVIAGVTGKETTEDALTGLAATVGNGVTFLSALFGVLTTFSSFLAVGLTLIRTLTIELRLRAPLAWTITNLVPLFLFVIGVQSLTLIFSITGALFLGSEGILIMLASRISRKVEKSSSRLRTMWMPLALTFLFLLGVGSELLRVFEHVAR